jgi:hypothetical protein
VNLNPIFPPGWPDEPTLPVPLLTVHHQHQFAQTEAAVHPLGGCDCSLALDECQCMCRPAVEPGEACTAIGAEPPRVVDTLRRQRRITLVIAIVLGAVICAVSLIGYGSATP